MEDWDHSGGLAPVGGKVHRGADGLYYSSPHVARTKQAPERVSYNTSGSDSGVVLDILLKTALVPGIIFVILGSLYLYDRINEFFDTAHGDGVLRIFIGMMICSIVTLPCLFFKKYPAHICHSIFGVSVGLFLVLIQTKSGTMGPVAFGHSPETLATALAGFSIFMWLYFTFSKRDHFKAHNLKSLKKEKFYHFAKDDINTAREKVAISAAINTRIVLVFIVVLSVFAYYDPNFSGDTTTVLRTIGSYSLILLMVLAHQANRGLGMHYFVGYTEYNPPVFIYLIAALGTVCAFIFAFIPYPASHESTPWAQAVTTFVFFSGVIGFTAFMYSRALKTIESNR